MDTMKCEKCGTELNESEKFCHQCGFPVNAPQATSSSDRSSSNSTVKKNRRVILSCGIGIALALIGVLVFFLTRDTFLGTYVSISGLSSQYTFEDDYYLYESDSSSERGKYSVEKTLVTLTDMDGNEEVFFRDNEYIFRCDEHYKEKVAELGNGKPVDAVLTYHWDLYVIGCLLTGDRSLILNSDGTYCLLTVHKNYAMDIENEDVVMGSYVCKGNLIILSPDGSNDTKSYIVQDGYLYTSVYMKQK